MPSYQLALVEERPIPYQSLYLDVYLAVPDEERLNFIELFTRAGCSEAAKIEHADLIVFGGGEDINPSLYGEAPLKCTYYNDERDEEDIEIYNEARTRRIPMVGVCRGAQFLHVMQGGSLFQDINNHLGDHHMYLPQDQRVLPTISSVHHQVCRYQSTMEIIGECFRSTYQEGEGYRSESETSRGRDIEAYLYRNEAIFGVQGHPEYTGYDTFAAWFVKCIQDYIVESPETIWTDEGLRVVSSPLLTVEPTYFNN